MGFFILFTTWIGPVVARVSSSVASTAQSGSDVVAVAFHDVPQPSDGAAHLEIFCLAEGRRKPHGCVSCWNWPWFTPTARRRIRDAVSVDTVAPPPSARPRCLTISNLLKSVRALAWTATKVEKVLGCTQSHLIAKGTKPYWQPMKYCRYETWSTCCPFTTPPCHTSAGACAPPPWQRHPTGIWQGRIADAALHHWRSSKASSPESKPSTRYLHHWRSSKASSPEPKPSTRYLSQAPILGENVHSHYWLRPAATSGRTQTVSQRRASPSSGP